MPAESARRSLDAPSRAGSRGSSPQEEPSAATSSSDSGEAGEGSAAEDASLKEPRPRKQPKGAHPLHSPLSPSI